MNNFDNLLKGHNKTHLILAFIFIIYLIGGYPTPHFIAASIDNIVGKAVIILIVIYMFFNTNPILAILALFAGYELLRRASVMTGTDALAKYCPSEEIKSSQFTAFNQFPYTLEQEVVSKMAPIMQTGSALNPPSFKPHMDNLHDATMI